MITTLIPAYKTEYIKDTLIGLANQKIKDFKVILSDDSPNDEVEKLLNSNAYKGLCEKINIQIVRGPKKGSMKNVLSLLDIWDNSTPFVHILFDDDVIYPSFYQMHLNALSKSNVGCSVSFRWMGNENAVPVNTALVPQFISESDGRIDIVKNTQLFKSVISNGVNWLGEFSNCVFSKDVINYVRESKLVDIPYYGLGDIGLILRSSLERDVAVIKDHLGVFRLNPHQNTGNLSSLSLRCAYLGWIALALSSLELKMVSILDAKKCIDKVSAKINARFQSYPEMLAFANIQNQYEIGSQEYKKTFNQMWSNILEQDISWTSSTQGTTA